MRLDSAREIKQAIASRFDGEMRTRGAEIRALDAPASRLSALAPQVPTVAVGVGVGAPGEYELAVRVQSRAAAAALDVDSLRREARGEIDVRYVGRVVKRSTPWHRRRQRPLLGGVSVGHVRVTAGTLGGFVGAADGRPAIISNNHVLADENEASVGDAIVQPGIADGGTEADRVAALARFVPLVGDAPNHVDAAIATLDDGIAFDTSGPGPPSTAVAGLGSHYESRLVTKTGRTTGATEGVISAFELDNVVVQYDLGPLRFDDQFEVDTVTPAAFSRGGDSGSLIVDAATSMAVGLLFAGSEVGGSHGFGVTFASPLGRALTSLEATLL